MEGKKFSRRSKNFCYFVNLITLKAFIMGITGLAKLIADVAPHAIKETEIKNYFGRKIAIDASKL